jgi:hypothetical protein
MTMMVRSSPYWTIQTSISRQVRLRSAFSCGHARLELARFHPATLNVSNVGLQRMPTFNVTLGNEGIVPKPVAHLSAFVS